MPLGQGIRIELFDGHVSWNFNFDVAWLRGTLPEAWTRISSSAPAYVSEA